MYKTKELARSESSIPDEMMLWRYEARSLRLMEMFDEADAAIQKRPLPHTSRIPADFDFNKAIDQACHRSCSELYTAYDRCMGKKKGDFQKCTGWYMPSPSYLPLTPFRFLPPLVMHLLCLPLLSHDLLIDLLGATWQVQHVHQLRRHVHAKDGACRARDDGRRRSGPQHGAPAPLERGGGPPARKYMRGA